MKQLLSQLWTLLIVTVVTMLVWLYAEDANIVEYTNQTVRVQFVLPSGVDALVRPGEPIGVEVDFNCSNGQYQQYINATRGKVIDITLPIKPDEDLQTLNVAMREQLERYVFGDLGINVKRVDQEQREATVEKIVDVSLDVRIVQDTGAIKLSSAQIPNEAERRVTVRLPASQAQRLVGAIAIARVAEEDVEGVAKGESKQFRVPVELPAWLSDLPALTADAGVVVTVANDRDKVTIDGLPILLSYPSSINERYVVSIDEATRIINALTLDGPRDTIAQLKADPKSPLLWATVKLTNQEADAAAASGGELTKPVDIITPSGVVVVSDVVRVTIRVTPRVVPPVP